MHHASILPGTSSRIGPCRRFRPLRKQRAWRPAVLETGGSLPVRHARTEFPATWKRPRPQRKRFRSKMEGQAGGGCDAGPATRASARPCANTRRWRTSWAGSAPLPASPISPTRPIRPTASSMATSSRSSPDMASHLLFFSLEMNRIDDAVIDAALAEPTRWRATTARGSSTCAWTSPTSSTTSWSSSSSKNR